MSDDFIPTGDRPDDRKLLKGRDILVLEHNGLVALDLSDLLLEMGAQQVRIAASLAEASAMALQARPDLAVLALPEKQGPVIGLAAQLSEDAVPVIFVSSFDEPWSEAKAIRAALVRKPISVDGLRAALTDILA